MRTLNKIIGRLWVIWMSAHWRLLADINDREGQARRRWAQATYEEHQNGDT